MNMHRPLKVELVTETKTDWFLNYVAGYCEIVPDCGNDTSVMQDRLTMLISNLMEESQTRHLLRAALLDFANLHGIDVIFPIMVLSVICFDELSGEGPRLLRVRFANFTDKLEMFGQRIKPVWVIEG